MNLYLKMNSLFYFDVIIVRATKLFNEYIIITLLILFFFERPTYNDDKKT